MKRHISPGDSSKGRARGGESRATRGFTLIELLMVTLIVGLLAGFALVRLDTVRERAYDSAALADLHNAFDEIERYFNEHFEYPDDEDDLFNEGFALSEGISFLKLSLRDGANPNLARVHMHIAHAGSPHYYHYEYPEGYAGLPEMRWK